MQVTTPGPLTVIDCEFNNILLTCPSLTGDIVITIVGSNIGGIYGKWDKLRIDDSEIDWVQDGGGYGNINDSCSLLRITDSDLGGVRYGNVSGTGRASDIILEGNRFGGDVTGLTGVIIYGVAGGTIVSNKFRGFNLAGVKAVRFEKDASANTNDGLFCGGNSYDNCAVGVSVASGALGPGTKIGPDGFDDTVIEYEGVPSGSMSLDHTILDGARHTDTLLGVVVDGDVIIGNATPKWSRLAISIPAANIRNVLGIDNGELRPSWKAALDATLPETIAAGGAGQAGTSLIFAHRDHNHPAPATWPPGAHTHAHGDLTGVTADQHHAGFVGLIINGPSTISPDASDLITIEDTATVTWTSSGAGKISATAAGAVPAAHDLDGALHTGVADYTSILGLASLSIDDANFFLDLVSSNPEINVDSGDYLAYNRASNYFSFVPGATEIARFYAGGVTIGTGAAPEATVKLDVEGNALVYGNLGITNDVSLKAASTTIGLSASHVSTLVAGGWTEIYGAVVANPAGASSAIFLALGFYAETALACAQNLTGFPGLQATRNTVLHQGTGTVDWAFVSENLALIQSLGGTITNVYGLYSGLVIEGGSTATVNVFRHIFIEDAVVGLGAVNYQYGIFIQDMDAATNNYPIYFEGTSGLARQGIWWNADTNLYRSAASTLKTDDNLVVALHEALGSGGSGIVASHVLDIQETFSGALGATSYRGISVLHTLDPSAATTGFHTALRFETLVAAGNNNTFEWLLGVLGAVQVKGTGAKAHVVGIKGDAYAAADNAAATDVIMLSAGGTITTAVGSSTGGIWGLEVNDLGVGWNAISSECVAIEILPQNAKGAAVAYGLQIGDITNATTVIPIYQMGTTGHNRIIAKTIIGADETPGSYTLTVKSAISSLLLESSSATAAGSRLDMKQLSASPADFDAIASQYFYGYNDALVPEQIEYGDFRVYAADVSDGTEDGRFEWQTMRAGSLSVGMTLHEAGQLRLPTTGSSAGLLVGADTLLYRGVADVWYSPDSLRLDGHMRIGSTAAPTNVTAGDLTVVRLFVGDAAAVAGKEALITGDMAITGTLVIGTAPNYIVTNAAVDRTYDADATTLDELADILGTLLADLTTMGLLQ